MINNSDTNQLLVINSNIDTDINKNIVYEWMYEIYKFILFN
jgi:hypothetical protein